MAIECLVLGAGQEVGKSCVIVTINDKRIMFDCGMHMGYTDHRRYPEFSLISDSGDFTSALSCVIITHFHLDHIGALPYFTQVCGYNGPIYMTYPTKALAPLMLEDYRKVMVDRRGEEEQFSFEHIAECMKKVLGSIFFFAWGIRKQHILRSHSHQLLSRSVLVEHRAMKHWMVYRFRYYCIGLLACAF